MLVAASQGHAPVVSALARGGADLNMRSMTGGMAASCSTALIEAVQGGHVECVRVLLKGGASRTIPWMGEYRSDCGKTAIDFAGSTGEIAVLLSAPAPAEADHTRAMRYYSLNAQEEKDMFDDADNAAIVAAVRAGRRSVQLAPKPYGQFEVRFGPNGNTDWGRQPKAPESGMVQVNLGNHNTRTVGSISGVMPEASVRKLFGLGAPPPGAAPRLFGAAEAPAPAPAPKWKRHFVGDREFWRWTGTDPATGQWYSKAEKDASIRFDAPAEGLVAFAGQDESTPPENRAWFEAQFDLAAESVLAFLGIPLASATAVSS